MGPGCMHLVVGLEMVDLLVEGKVPELLADEDHGLQLVLEAGRVTREPLNQALPNTTAHSLQHPQSFSLPEEGHAHHQQAPPHSPEPARAPFLRPPSCPCAPPPSPPPSAPPPCEGTRIGTDSPPPARTSQPCCRARALLTLRKYARTGEAQLTSDRGAARIYRMWFVYLWDDVISSRSFYIDLYAKHPTSRRCRCTVRECYIVAGARCCESRPASLSTLCCSLHPSGSLRRGRSGGRLLGCF